jgi:hypothetical protein
MEPRARPRRLEAKPKIALSDLKASICQSAVRNDIRAVFDMERYHLGMIDKYLGRVNVLCEIYFTFKNFDALMYLEFQIPKSKNTILKLVLNHKDIQIHISPSIQDFIRDKVEVRRLLYGFLKRVVFVKAANYMKVAVQYKRRKGHVYQYSNCFRNSNESHIWLEKRHMEQEVIGQFVKKFWNYFSIFTVFKVTNINGFEVEVYFPKVQKRFLFQMFNDEIQLIDRATIQKVYEIGGEDIKTLTMMHKGDYKKVKEEIWRIMVIQNN